MSQALAALARGMSLEAMQAREGACRARMAQLQPQLAAEQREAAFWAKQIKQIKRRKRAGE